ncbi:MAG TPA: hypothetical protein VIC85_21775 [Ktedonobacterales bacterium]
MRRGTRGSERRSRRIQGAWWGRGYARPLALAAGVWLCLVLAACASGATSGTTPTATTGTTASGATATSTDDTGTANPTTTPFGNGTPSAALGASDVCATTPPSSVASLPSNIPPYPSARVDIGETSGHQGVFGLCTGDSVSAVTSYYAQKLPLAGWQQVTNTAIATSQLFTASAGQANLNITISPSGAVQGKTQIYIIYSGI